MMMEKQQFWLLWHLSLSLKCIFLYLQHLFKATIKLSRLILNNILNMAFSWHGIHSLVPFSYTCTTKCNPIQQLYQEFYFTRLYVLSLEVEILRKMTEVIVGGGHTLFT